MNSVTTMIIFLGITFTLVGSTGSIIVLCMHFIVWAKEKCKKRRDDVKLFVEDEESGEEVDFVTL